MKTEHFSKKISWSAIGAAALALALIANHPARAELQIQEPEVEAGSVEFQFTNGWSSGDPTPKPGQEIEYTKQSHEAEIQIGISNFLMIEIGAELEKERELEFEEAEDDEPGGIEKTTSSLQFTELEIGVQLELLTVQKHGFGLALTAGFTKAQIDEENDQVNWGAIAKIAHGPLSLTTNTYFSDPRTDDAVEDHVNFEYGIQTLYQLNGNIAIGAEAIGEIDDVYNAGSTSTQPHRLGPVVYLSWQRGEEQTGLQDDNEYNSKNREDDDEEEGLEVTLGLGALIGLTDVTPDTTLKADLAIEF